MIVGRAAGVTDTGRRRRRNEDAFVCEPPLFAIADGMGGAQAGELASGLAAAAIEEAGAGAGDAEAVASAVRAANARIFERSLTDPAVAGMTATRTTRSSSSASGGRRRTPPVSRIRTSSRFSTAARPAARTSSS